MFWTGSQPVAAEIISYINDNDDLVQTAAFQVGDTDAGEDNYIAIFSTDKTERVFANNWIVQINNELTVLDPEEFDLRFTKNLGVYAVEEKELPAEA